MTAKLIAEEGLLKGLVLSMDEGQEWIIGRDPDECQLLVEDPAASRKQLMCRLTPEGIFAENLSITNPTQVNEEEIHEPRLLHHGDTLKIGSGTFRFYTDTLPHIETATPQEPSNLNGKQENPMLEERDTIFEEETEETPIDQDLQVDLLDTGPWLLKVVAGPNNGAEFSMQTDMSYVIGTDPAACDIVFNDVSVSRQHARLSISPHHQVYIEDLKSRNGTSIEGKMVQGKMPLSSNTLVSVGTTTFIVYDREGERQTIISPLLPAIVKVLQQEEEKKEKKPTEEAKKSELEGENGVLSPSEKLSPVLPPAAQPPEKKFLSIGNLVLASILTGVFVVAGIGTMLLFKSEKVETPKVDIDALLSEAMAPFPSVKYSFNKNNERLLLVGHVLTSIDRNQLLYTLRALSFVESIDDNIIIDEFIWQEMNQVLSKNPSWKGVAMHASSPGHFVITGYLQTRKQSEQLLDYISQNFSYPDLLENRIVVEEDVMAQIDILFQEAGLRDIVVKMSNGEITLSGNILQGQTESLMKIIEKIRGMNGVRAVKNFVAELPTEETVINITDNYPVTGFSNQVNGKISVVIRGKILSTGDILDGMMIKEIKPQAILLEKDGVKYRIDYNH